MLHGTDGMEMIAAGEREESHNSTDEHDDVSTHQPSNLSLAVHMSDSSFSSESDGACTNVNEEGKATKLCLSNFSSVHMRAFHMSWMALFLCFIGWFGLSPLLHSVMLDIDLTTDQITFSNQASLAVTIFMRVCMGVVCDRIGPRKAYSFIMFIGAVPLIFVSFVNSFASFTVCRTLIGVLGASFVITEYHTGVMFAPNKVGLAAATAAGWGNLGGGVTNSVMPYIAAKMGYLFGGEKGHDRWRPAVIVPGVALVIFSFLYYRGTKDGPFGNRNEVNDQRLHLNRTGRCNSVVGCVSDIFAVITDYRVVILTLAYAACFGVELVFLTQGSLYFMHMYQLSDTVAGNIVLSFSCLNIFARPFGGYVSDKFALKKNLHWRVYWLCGTLFLEGLLLILFWWTHKFDMLVVVTFACGLMTMLAEGAVYAVVPFINEHSLGLVSGIVAAGGSIGGVCGLSLFRHGIAWEASFFYLAVIVTGVSFIVPFLRFPQEKLTHYALTDPIYHD